MKKPISLLVAITSAIAMLPVVSFATAPINNLELPIYTIISENVSTKSAPNFIKTAKLMSASIPTRPLILHIEQKGVAYYEGVTQVTGYLVIDATDNSPCTYCFYIDEKSSSMIPRANIETNTTKRNKLFFNIDTRDLSALDLSKYISEDNACYSVPMTLDIENYVAIYNSRQEPSDARIVNVVEKGAIDKYTCL